MTENKPTINNGMGFCGWLALLFIALKLTGFIQWSWWWVLAPLWIPLTLALGMFILAGIFLLIGVWLDDKPKLDKRWSRHFKP
jgi:hypothetical protein